MWPYARLPADQIGKLVLDRLPDNFFAEVEQAAFDPAHFVPGIGPSPDKMLQARLFALRRRAPLPARRQPHALPVNAPRGVAGGARNYGRDGAMRFDDNGGGAKNYEPNSFDGPRQTDEALYAGLRRARAGTGHYAQVRHAEDDDFVQAGDALPPDAGGGAQRLVDNIAGSLAQVSRDDIIERSIGHFRRADETFGQRIADGVAARRGTLAGVAK